MGQILTKEDAIQRLKRNRINVVGDKIELKYQAIGLKCQSAVDCLVKYHGFTTVRDNGG